eukprot:UN25921
MSTRRLSETVFTYMLHRFIYEDEPVFLFFILTNPTMFPMMVLRIVDLINVSYIFSCFA